MVCCAIFFDMGWIFPFAPYLGWMSHPAATVTFFVVAGIFLFLGLFIAPDQPDESSSTSMECTESPQNTVKEPDPANIPSQK